MSPIQKHPETVLLVPVVHILNQQRMPSLDLVEVRWSIAKGKRPNLDYWQYSPVGHWRQSGSVLDSGVSSLRPSGPAATIASHAS